LNRAFHIVWHQDSLTGQQGGCDIGGVVQPVGSSGNSGSISSYPLTGSHQFVQTTLSGYMQPGMHPELLPAQVPKSGMVAPTAHISPQAYMQTQQVNTGMAQVQVNTGAQAPTAHNNPGMCGMASGSFKIYVSTLQTTQICLCASSL